MIDEENKVEEGAEVTPEEETLNEGAAEESTPGGVEEASPTSAEAEEETTGEEPENSDEAGA